MPDPFIVLGVPENADDAQVRAAYLEAVRRFPPERAPEMFQYVSEAHKALGDEVSRARVRLFGSLDRSSIETPETLLPEMPAPRRRIGMERWLSVISRNCAKPK